MRDLAIILGSVLLQFAVLTAAIVAFALWIGILGGVL